MSESAERASSQHSSMQQDLERTRQQANEALKAMDAERQQLRSANNKYITLRYTPFLKNSSFLATSQTLTT